MKLIGSRTEKEYREELTHSHKALFEGQSDSRLLASILSNCPSMKTAYIVDWIPEQGEDIYFILIDTDALIVVEADRSNSDSPPIIENLSLKEYEKNLGRQGLIKLAVAIELAQNSEDEDI